MHWYLGYLYSLHLKKIIISKRERGGGGYKVSRYSQEIHQSQCEGAESCSSMVSTGLTTEYGRLGYSPLKKSVKSQCQYSMNVLSRMSLHLGERSSVVWPHHVDGCSYQGIPELLNMRRSPPTLSADGLQCQPFDIAYSMNNLDLKAFVISTPILKALCTREASALRHLGKA